MFFLHSSAFIINDTIFILMANSGTGKSTIAHYVNNQPDSIRIADDMLPLKFEDDKLTVYPNFPQLKLSQDEQYKGGKLVKNTVLLFTKKSEASMIIKPIDKFSAIKKMISHSVATRLFAENELKNHLDFCYKTCNQVNSYQVNYSHSKDSLPKLFKLLNEIS